MSVNDDVMSGSQEVSFRGAPLEGLRTTANIVYALYLLSFLGGLTVIVGLIIAYIRSSDAEGTLYHSHFRSQIRVFWLNILFAIIGVILLVALPPIGIIVLIGITVWFYYRIIKGLIGCIDRRPFD